MNNINLVCAGNCFTKPLMCWSLMDWLLVMVLLGVIYVIIIALTIKK